MAHATFVKAARKDYPQHGIKKGESYYWWSFRSPGGRGGSGRYFSKTPPRGSQLTRSEFKGALLSAEEQLSDLKPESYESVADLESDLQSIRDEVEQAGSDCQEKFDNMPEGLQQGDTGQLLENRVNECESLTGEFDSLDFDEPDQEAMKPVKDETVDEAKARAVHERCEEILDEVSGFNWSID